MSDEFLDQFRKKPRPEFAKSLHERLQQQSESESKPAPKIPLNGKEDQYDKNKKDSKMNMTIPQTSVVSRPIHWRILAASFVAVTLLGGIVFSLIPNDANLTQTEYLVSAEEQNMNVFQVYIDEAWNKGNVEVLDNILTPNADYHDPLMAAKGQQAIKDLVTHFRTGLPDLVVRVDSVNADGTSVWAQVTLIGTQTGDLNLSEWAALPASNQAIELTQTIVARFEDDKIAEVRTEMDTLSLMEQLGYVSSFEQIAIEQQNLAAERGYIETVWATQEEVTDEVAAEFSIECAVVYEPSELKPFGQIGNCPAQFWGAGLANALRIAFPEGHTLTIDQMMAQDDIVIVHFTWQGVRSGWFDLIAPSNDEEQLDFTFIERYENGKKVESWAYWIAPFIYERYYDR